MMPLAGRRVLVIGLGVSGFAAARALARLDAKVRVTEAASSAEIEERARRLTSQGIEVETGGHDLAALDGDLAVVSPGISPTAAVVKTALEAGIEVIGEVELAYRLASCDFLAVTGTNGKTTTTSLLAAMLEAGGVVSAAAGNIGLPLIDAVSTIPDSGAIALEVSSFQLETTRGFRPAVAILLNVAEDHTDWHGSVEDYAAAKARITANQKPEDVFVYNSVDRRAAAIAATSRARLVPFSGQAPAGDGVGIVDGDIVAAGRRLLPVDAIPLPGAAGLEDVMAAAGAALAYGVDPGAVTRSVKDFRPLSHRLEVVAEAGGVTFIDDSKATNPHATLMAVKGLDDVVLIAGGRSKGIDLSVLGEVVPPVRGVVALGEAAEELASVFEPLTDVVRAASMEEAVASAASMSVAGGSVLLSPACASLDMYKSYAQRGEDFTRCVRALIGRTEDDGES